MNDSALKMLLADFGSKLAALQPGSKAVSSTPSSPYLHGPNGMWSYPGVDRPIINVRMTPKGIASLLPTRANNEMYPLYGFMTGFTDPAESQPTGVCDDPPTAGQHKNAFQTATYGRYSYQTRVMDILRLGQIINRSEDQDFSLVGNPLSQDGSLTWPDSAPGGMSLVNEAASRFTEVGIKFQNKLMKQLWYGNPSNNTAGGGYKEFPGIDRLIRTGIRDAVTGATVGSLDSTILNANYKNVNVVTGNDNIVNVLTYLWRNMNIIAEGTGLSPVRWVFAMRPLLFYEISAVWPCSYLTYRCTTQNGSMTMDAGDAISLRDSMRQERFLIIDGERVDVVLDDAIDEETSGDTNRITNGSFASDIFLLPLSVQGGTFASLYWEYFNFAGPNAAFNLMGSMPLASNFFWSDGGRYAWHFKPPTNWCVQWLGLVEPRVVLRTPHLAAKLQHVQYSPLMHERDVFPDDPYFLNGGNTSLTTAPSLYNSWS